MKIVKRKKQRKDKKSFHFYKRYFILLLLPIAYLFTEFAYNHEEFVEQIFSRHIYRWCSIVYSGITKLVPFSIAEIAIVIVPIVLILYISNTVYKAYRNREERGECIHKLLLNVACIVSILLFTNTMLCSLNYYRYPFAKYRGIKVKESSVEELLDLCMDLSNQANELREEVLKEDENGVFTLSTSKRETGEKARIAMNELGEIYPVLAGWDVAPKSVLLSNWMSYTQITGIFVPFTMEANVNVAVSDYSIPATMCHELTHLRGFMREDEANYIAYLACTNIDDVEFNYSGIMDALISAGNALYRQDKERYVQIRDNYSDKVTRDLIANANYWAKFEDTTVSTVSNQINDSYLKANNQTDGVKSYGRMVDLLLAEYRLKQK